MRAGDSITPAGARTPGAEWRLGHSNGGAGRTDLLGNDRGKGLTRDDSTKGGGKPQQTKSMPGAGLIGVWSGKAPSERPALKPYWGKPAVRVRREKTGRRKQVRTIKEVRIEQILPWEEPTPKKTNPCAGEGDLTGEA